MLNFDTNDCCKVSKYSKELKALSKYRDFCKTFYLGQDVDGENVYGGKNDEVRFKNVDDMVKVLDSVIDILHEYEEKQDKDAQALERKPEETKVNSQALDILARLQSEFPIYARSIHAIEATPNTEKLEFWCMPPDYFEDPEPETMKKDESAKNNGIDTSAGIIKLHDILHNTEPKLVKGDSGKIELQFNECIGEDYECLSRFLLEEFVDALYEKNKEDTENDDR